MSSLDATEILQSFSYTREQASVLRACAMGLRESGWQRAVRWRIAAVLDGIADDLDHLRTN